MQIGPGKPKISPAAHLIMGTFAANVQTDLLAVALVANAMPAAARDVRDLLGGGTSTIVDDDVSVDGVVRTSTHVPV